VDTAAKKIDNGATFSMLIAGLGYPLIAFFVVAILSNMFFDRILRSYSGSSASDASGLAAGSRKRMRRVNVKTHCLLADTRIALLIGEDVMNK